MYCEKNAYLLMILRNTLGKNLDNIVELRTENNGDQMAIFVS